MQVINRTRMPAELHIAADKRARDHFVLIVKATFDVRANGGVRLSPLQAPFIYADEHYGDPGATSIRYACDFVLTKPSADILLNGHAYAPGGRPARQVDVTVQLGNMTKRVRVFGDRQWSLGILGYQATLPEPFTKIPLLYELAFGGADTTAANPSHHGTDVRNTVGRGFRVTSDPGAIVGSPLPNLEDPSALVTRLRDRPRPMAFGCIGRNWQPRVQLAGTYDQHWIDERYPFLPFDFDERYFQSAPADQQLPYLQGGEEVRCTNVTPGGTWSFQLPNIEFTVIFVFSEYHVETLPRLDTVLLEPDLERVILTWRASVPVRTKMYDLIQVLVGPASATQRRALEKNKPIFASLSEFLAWRKRNLLALSNPTV